MLILFILHMDVHWYQLVQVETWQMKACALTLNGLDDGENNVKEVEPGVKIKNKLIQNFSLI